MPERNSNGRRHVPPPCRKTSHTHYLASSASTFLSFMARRSKMRLGGSYRRSWLSRATLVPWTGSENHPSSIAVCQLTSFRTKLHHARCHRYLEMRCRHWSPRCEVLSP